MGMPLKRVIKSRLPEYTPAASAAFSALIYVVFATLYIFLSGRIAAALAGSVENLQKIEMVKGLVFVAVTGLFFFFISLGWWRRTRKQRQLLAQSERRAFASMYSAALAHDLNNLLMCLSAVVEGIREHEEVDPNLKKMRLAMEKSIGSLTPLAKRIASSARLNRQDEFMALELRESLEKYIEIARKHPDVKLCSVHADDIPRVALKLNGELFEQAVLNLIINAAQAGGPECRIEIKSRWEGVMILVEIHDNGPGVAEDLQERIFDTGYTTKTTGNGLGLLSVQAFASSCQARLSVHRSHLGGALFRIQIPVGRQESEAAFAAGSPVPSL